MTQITDISGWTDAKHCITALEAIAALADATEVRGPFEDIDTPDHLIKEAAGYLSAQRCARV